MWMRWTARWQQRSFYLTQKRVSLSLSLWIMYHIVLQVLFMMWHEKLWTPILFCCICFGGSFYFYFIYFQIKAKCFVCLNEAVNIVSHLLKITKTYCVACKILTLCLTQTAASLQAWPSQSIVVWVKNKHLPYSRLELTLLKLHPNL